ncbi:MAG: peroxiredoxin [Parachlamydiaceae bacterium]|nr:peroxiredoxin [Parachlamydiaceae bacterium]
MKYALNIGDKAPEFKGEDQNGKAISLENMKGKMFVIYFYPMDDTPGCALEACSFRDNLAGLQNLGIDVVGVSPDNSQSHEKFSLKHKLNFSLIPDESLEICRKYDIYRTKDEGGKTVQKLERTTFIVGPQGQILWAERPVNVEGHLERVLDALKTESSKSK